VFVGRITKRLFTSSGSAPLNTLEVGHWLRTASSLAAVASSLFAAGTAFATEQAQQRQQGRAVNQAAKHEARSTRQDCRAENQNSNAQCRQDNRNTKQEGRQDKRDIKY